ncbi:MAG: hypothetical protein ACI4B9_04155, partial [Eggerthellaceae bacterium]
FSFRKPHGSSNRLESNKPNRTSKTCPQRFPLQVYDTETLLVLRRHVVGFLKLAKNVTFLPRRFLNLPCIRSLIFNRQSPY